MTRLRGRLGRVKREESMNNNNNKKVFIKLEILFVETILSAYSHSACACIAFQVPIIIIIIGS